MSIIKTFVEDYYQEFLGILRDLTNLDTPSTDKAGVDKLVNYLLNYFKGIAVEATVYEEDKYGNHLKIVYGQGANQILVLSHMDTVWPMGETNKRPFRIDGDKAFGPGVYDMKIGIAQSLIALRYFCQNQIKLPLTLTFFYNSDEEIGSPSSKKIIEEEALKSKYVLVLEPSEPTGWLKTSRKGVGMYEVVITGKASHAGNAHAQGISAIKELASQILFLESITDYSAGTTVNVGVISGGSRRNVVPAEAKASVDLRITSEEQAKLAEKQILSLKPINSGTEIVVTGGINRPPMVKTQKTLALFNIARDLAQDLGLDLKDSSSGGGSDGNFTAAMGIPTLDGLGGVGDYAHSENEYVLLKEVSLRTALLISLIEKLAYE